MEFWALWPQVTQRPNSALRRVRRSTQALCLTNSAEVRHQRPGEPGQLEAKAKNLNLMLQPSSSLTLPLGQRATPCAQGSTQVRQGSWVPQGQRGAPGIQTTSPGQGVGQGAGGRCRGSWWHGEAGGAHADLTDVHPLQSASLSLCLRLEPCQECSHPLMKKQSTFLSSLSRPHNAAPSQTPWSP